MKKQCHTCKEEKDRNQFTPVPRNPDGLDYNCKKCNSARVSKKNKERKEDRDNFFKNFI